MTDLIIMLPGSVGKSVDARHVRQLIRARKATVASFCAPRREDDGALEKAQFCDYYMQSGSNLSEIDANFRLRDIILLKCPVPSAGTNFILIHLWGWPESTYDIDAIRIPHGGFTDPRNNPTGKNPGNIWSFSETLSDGKKGFQRTLFENRQGNAVFDGKIELEAIKRLIQCHTLEKDFIHTWANDDDAREVGAVARRLGRHVRPLPEGEPDPWMESEVVVSEPFEGTDDTEKSDEQPISGGKTDGTVFSRFYIIDCRQGLREIDIGSVDDVVTSPPYNIGYEPFNVPKKDRDRGTLRAPNREGYDDSLTQSQYHFLIKSTLETLDQRMNPVSSDVFLNIKNNYGGGECRPPFWAIRLAPREWKLSDLLIWRYDISYDPAKNKYKPYYEWILRFTKGRVNLSENHVCMKDFYIPILKGNSRERANLKHPAIYPKALVKCCLKESRHNGLVVDPFLGSGTTIAAAWELGRPSVGFEIDKSYVHDIEERLARVRRVLGRG